jgi:hypothetical protein
MSIVSPMAERKRRAGWATAWRRVRRYSLVWSDAFGVAATAPDPGSGSRDGGHGGNRELQYPTDSTGNAAWTVQVIWLSWCGGRIRRRPAGMAAARTPPRG